MKFESTKANLVYGLQFVSGIVGKNVNLPILTNILLEAKKGTINLIATNLEVGITSTVRGKVHDEGKFTVPGKLLLDFVQTLPEGTVTFEQKNNDTIITCGKHKGTLRGVPADDFPLIPKLEEGKPCDVPLQEFLSALQNVVSAIAINETRPEISGCLFRFSGKEFTLVGTDSFRLAEKKLSLSNNPYTGKSVIIPIRTVQELIKMLSSAMKGLDVPETVIISISENQILFSLDGIELLSRIIEGTYPDYTQIIPANFVTKVTISKYDLLQAVKSVSLFSEAGISDVTLSGKKKSLVIESGGSQSGEGTAEIDASITGDSINLTLNSRYLNDALITMQTEEVLLSVNSADSPCMLTPIDESTKYLYIIMPIRQ